MGHEQLPRVTVATEAKLFVTGRRTHTGFLEPPRPCCAEANGGDDAEGVAAGREGRGPRQGRTKPHRVAARAQETGGGGRRAGPGRPHGPRETVTESDVVGSRHGGGGRWRVEPEA